MAIDQKPMMGCGHAANATRSEDQSPVCAICIGIYEGADKVVAAPDLTGRKAFCTYGHHGETSSSTRLAFFEYRPTVDTDKYYCGCYGWD